MYQPPRRHFLSLLAFLLNVFLVALIFFIIKEREENKKALERTTAEDVKPIDSGIIETQNEPPAVEVNNPVDINASSQEAEAADQLQPSQPAVNSNAPSAAANNSKTSPTSKSSSSKSTSSKKSSSATRTS